MRLSFYIFIYFIYVFYEVHCKEIQNYGVFEILENGGAKFASCGKLIRLSALMFVRLFLLNDAEPLKEKSLNTIVVEVVVLTVLHYSTGK